MAHTFTGRTLVEAHQAAEDTLGEDFVVLDTRRVKKKGMAGLLGGALFEIEAGHEGVGGRPFGRNHDVVAGLIPEVVVEVHAAGIVSPTTHDLKVLVQYVLLNKDSLPQPLCHALSGAT